MIALRPLSGTFTNKMTWKVKEGAEIPKQILDLLKTEEAKRSGLICDDIKAYNKIKTDEKSKDTEAEKKGDHARNKLIKDRESKKHKKPETPTESNEEANR